VKRAPPFPGSSRVQPPDTPLAAPASLPAEPARQWATATPPYNKPHNAVPVHWSHDMKTWRHP